MPILARHVDVGDDFDIGSCGRVVPGRLHHSVHGRSLRNLDLDHFHCRILPSDVEITLRWAAA